MKKNSVAALFVVGLMAASCVQPPDYPSEPELAYIGFNKTTIFQGIGDFPSDTLELRLSFTDGDGDLGYEDGTLDVTIIDNRDGFEQQRRLPVIPEQGVGNGISGEIRLRFPNKPCELICFYPDGAPGCETNTEVPTDTLSYDVFIIDRAGNQSNTITTEQVVILCNP